jgi:ribosomal protein L35
MSSKNKFKVLSAFSKRFNVRPGGSVTKKRAFTSHLSASKTRKRKLRLRKSTILKSPNYKRSSRIINFMKGNVN